MRRAAIGLATAGAVAAMLAPVPSLAESLSQRHESARPPVRDAFNRSILRVRAGAGSERKMPEPPSRSGAVPPDLDQRRRDGHMTPEERRLLRQHIEDAVRELYKR